MTDFWKLTKAADPAYQISWNVGAANSDLWKYQFHALTLTINYLNSSIGSLLVVINLADTIA